MGEAHVAARWCQEGNADLDLEHIVVRGDAVPIDNVL